MSGAGEEQRRDDDLRLKFVQALCVWRADAKMPDFGLSLLRLTVTSGRARGRAGQSRSLTVHRATNDLWRRW